MSAAKSQGGRPEHSPTPEQRAVVSALATYGMPQDSISRELGISKPTLLKHYDFELKNGKHRANAKVAESLFKRATGTKPAQGDVAAMIFWLKTQAGWKETTVVEHGIAGVSHDELANALFGGAVPAAAAESGGTALEGPDAGTAARP